LFDGVSWSINISFAGSTGTIQQALWDSMPNGVVIIRFYAEDTVGHIGFKDVNVTKDTTPLNQNGGGTDEIDVADIFISVGTISVISAIFIIILVRMRTKRFIK